MHATLRSLALPLAGLLGACLPPPLQDCTDTGCTTPAPVPSDDSTLPTTSHGDEIQTVTGNDPTTTDPTDTTSSSTAAGSTAPDLEEDPAVLGVEVDPDPIKFNGLIAVDVSTAHADGVHMALDNGDIIELAPAGAGNFQAQIPAFTGLDNGMHTAVLTPWRDALDGVTEDAHYTIDLPEPGSQGFWESGDLVGVGVVAALDVLPDDTIVEFGTFYEKGEPRCYLRRRDRSGAWFPGEFLSMLPNSPCTAIDLKIDHELGTIHVLASRKGGDGLHWWLGEISSWGLGPKNLGLGAVGDKAEALASAPGMLAVCGSKQAPTLDLDAAAWLHRPNQPVEPLLFDYVPDQDFAHRFDETARDCSFVGDVLVLVGEAAGKHSTDPKEPKRDRLFVLEHDTLTDMATWTVAGPGPGTQSRALALDVDDEGRYLLAGYACGDACEPDGEVRIYLPGGKLDWQASLGPLGTDAAGPHDIAWSPAGYIVIALAEFSGQTLRFKVQALAPHVYQPLWTFLPADMQGLQIALALAIGRYGEIYAGGFGASSYPAVAFIPG
jgi:hypothetical protein